jgi:hypothetical protein
VPEINKSEVISILTAMVRILVPEAEADKSPDKVIPVCETAIPKKSIPSFKFSVI